MQRSAGDPEMAPQEIGRSRSARPAIRRRGGA